MGCHVLLQGIFPTQGSNLRLLHRQAGSYNRATWEAPVCPYVSVNRQFSRAVPCLETPAGCHPRRLEASLLRAQESWGHRFGVSSQCSPMF